MEIGIMDGQTQVYQHPRPPLPITTDEVSNMSDESISSRNEMSQATVLELFEYHPDGYLVNRITG